MRIIVIYAPASILAVILLHGLYSVQQLELTKSRDFTYLVKTDRLAGAITAIKYSPDDSSIAVASVGSLSIWQADGTVRRAHTMTDMTVHSHNDRASEIAFLKNYVFCLAWSADGSFIVTGELRGRVTVWDLAMSTSRIAARVFCPIEHVVISDNGQTATAALSEQCRTRRGVIRIDLRNLNDQQITSFASYYVSTLGQFSSRQLVGLKATLNNVTGTGPTYNLSLVDLNNDTVLLDDWRLDGELQSSAISPDRRFIAVSAWNTQKGPTNSQLPRQAKIYLYNAVNGTLTATVERDYPIRRMEFDSRGRLLAGVTPNGDLAMIDVPLGKEIMIAAPDERFTCIAFSHNGEVITAGTMKGNIVRWKCDRILKETGMR